MKYRLAINGYGRIGRSVLRAIYECPKWLDIFDVVAINELADIGTMAYLTRYDSTHGRFPGSVTHDEHHLIINGKYIEVSHAEKPEMLRWSEKCMDLLLECSGAFSSRQAASSYLDAGPERLLFSQPAKADVDKTIIFGINHHQLEREDKIVSCGSCTTNCLVPVLKILHEHFGIEEGATTTIHSAMNDQPVTDAYHHTNLRLTRAAMQALIPVETRLDRGIDRILPELAGKFRSNAIRIPTINVSLIDLVVRLSCEVDVDQINQLFEKYSNDQQIASILGYSSEPHASVDFNHDRRSVIIDGTQTRVSNGVLLKMLCWFDNEWAFSNRMLDTAFHWLKR